MPQKFTVDALLGLCHPTNRVPLHLSPDGQILAITTQSYKRDADSSNDDSYTTDGVPRGMVGSRVLIIDTITGAAQEPFPRGAISWAAQWSPDGTHLAAYVQYEGPACLGVWERATGNFRLYSHVVVRPFFGFEIPRWTPDSLALVIKTQETTTHGNTNPPKKKNPGPASVFTFSPDTPIEQATVSLAGWADGYRCDLVLLNIGTGAVQLLAKNWRIIGWKIAPAGNEVAVLRYTKHTSRLQQFYFDLMILSLDGGEPRLLAAYVPQAYGICFNWSPDGKYLAYTTQERGSKDGIFVVPADGSTSPHALHDPRQEFILHDDDVETPRWSENGQMVYCSAKNGYWEFAADGSTRRQITFTTEHTVLSSVQPPATATVWMPTSGKLLFITRNDRTKDTGLLLTDLGSGESTMLLELAKRPGWLPFEMDASLDGSTMYLLLEASHHPAEVWQFFGNLREPRRLYSFNPNLDARLGASHLLEYRTLDGKLRQAALLLPSGYQEGSTVPVIVAVYGGVMNSKYLHLFGCTEDVLHGQIFASHGYAVLCPDIPLTDRDPLKQLPGQVIPAINHLIDLGIADPKRIGLVGHSYGGYCALALLTQTDLFAAAVASAGCYNLISEYLTLDQEGNDDWLGWTESGQGRMGGTLWEKREGYIENSPIFYLDRVQTPILLVCGSRDSSAPVEAGAVFVGLRRLGRKVELRRYEGEDHWPGRWSEASYRDLCERVLAWFDEHLKRE
jgi:dipeptidyl aminopeptidase/acylaminoacyl peptidase